MATETEVTKVSCLGKEIIHCGFHLIPYIADTVLTTLPASTYVLITDTNIARLHLTAFQSEFDAAITRLDSKSRFLTHIIPPGETSKSREGKAEIEDYLLANHCTRDTVILALGGGVIGDLTGFVAATFMRGVRFVQIPTTLLAMVDSSVGGKTAIDTPNGKNLIGAFWQPEYVFIDAAFLETLPVREFSNGMAEVVKTAAIWKADDFAMLEARATEIFAAIQAPSKNYAGRTLATRSESQGLLLHVIAGSIGVKAHIVTIDERETGLRNLVNFGHTIGHAIEAILTPAILHGECVAIGMVLEAEVSRSLGKLGQVGVGRIARCLKSYNLPVSVKDPRIARLPASRLLSIQRLLDIMRIDKKNSGPHKKIVLLASIGKTAEEKASVVEDGVISKVLAESCRVIPGTPTKNPIRMATPGSKSISNRAFVLAALGSGTCRLTNMLISDDTGVMMAALQDLKGATFEWEDGGETLVVHGGSGALTVPPAGKELYLQNAGTAARFLTTVCALASAGEGSGKRTVVTGNARMKQRPIGPLVESLRANGTAVDFLEGEGCLPLSIAPNGLKGGRIELAASVSSQYVSSILLCAPYAAEPVTLALTGGQVISQPYIDMTIAMMRTFGINVEKVEGEDTYKIPKGTYTNPSAYAIESDASSATYPLAVAAITGTTCTVENIGAASLQGDARFAVDVLKHMGCEVTQTDNETTVTGPPRGQLKALGLVDMEPMTDAFLTATALAAVATLPCEAGRELEGESRPATRIIGIANQRVKECNRIRAMIDELAKFGVETKELDDGLEIYGKPIESLKEGVKVHTYDDHRVAMAFSVLGTIIGGTILEEKRCVEKTWPNWWDDLENKIGLKVEGVELDEASAQSSTSRDPEASVVIIGMRGGGKSYIGKLSASTLNWPCIDADLVFEERYGMPIKTFVHEKGWKAFRDGELEILKELIQEYPKRTVLSLGGGIVETPEARDVLKAYGSRGPVVHIMRHIDEIALYLGGEASRPAFGEPIRDVWARRAPWFADVRTHEFINRTGFPLLDGPQLEAGDAILSDGATMPPQPPRSVREEVTRFFGQVTGTAPNLAPNVLAGKRSYFLSLTFPDIRPYLHRLDELATGADAFELRVDLLRTREQVEKGVKHGFPPLDYVRDQVAALRRESSLPIVYTIRSVSQIGSHPDAAIDEAFELMELGLRLGVEYLDVEITWPKDRIAQLLKNKGATVILASHHDVHGKMSWTGPEPEAVYQVCDSIGDIIKIVGLARTLEDNLALNAFVDKKTATPGAKPFLAINMGVAGQLSRTLNKVFSPITHPLMPFKAAPGQMTFNEIQRSLALMGCVPPKRFFLFGNITHSMSPTIHNTAFELLGMPHHYEVIATDELDERVKAALARPDFGGASVTIPYKREIMPFLQELSHTAQIIGAVNTIYPVTLADGSRGLKGDNTDWLGIRAVIHARLPPAVRTVHTALIIGAGGTARAAIYTLHAMGAERIYLYNRSRGRAETLIDAIPGAKVILLEKLGEWPGEPPSVVVGTVPAEATKLDDGATHATDTRIVLPSALFRPEGGVVVDMAYKPAQTPLLRLARTQPTWKPVLGVEVLLEQAYAQFMHWTDRRVPREPVAKTVWKKYHESQ